MWAIIIVFSVIGFFVEIVYLPLYFKSIKYYVSPKRVIKVSGVIVTSRQIVKTNSIQYTTVIGTPFSKCTGLNFMVLNTFGGQMVLYFLKKNDVDEIISIVEAYSIH
jgi:membrane protein YdbS with pleckstrin-like domain